MTVAGAHVVFHRLLRVSPKGVIPQQFVQAVLLCKRTLDAPIHPGFWALFGGTRDNGEEPVVTVRREVKEELNVRLQPNQLKELFDVVVARSTLKVRYYSYVLNYDLDRLTLQRNVRGKVEGEGLGWFSAEETHHLMVRPEDRVAVNSFFTKHGA